jgi:hypothetical protein
MKLKSFGCSFIYGSDLADCNQTSSQSTWPALIAKKSGLEYKCFARPGIGNLRILESILSESVDSTNDLYVIGWTWIDRFDFTDLVDSWETILPVDQTIKAEFYYRNLHSQYRDKLSTLIYIKTAIDTLEQKKIPFIMTYMDELIFENTWHTTPAITNLQQHISHYMCNFEEKTFLDWSRKNNYPISDLLHPLEPAHTAAADLILKMIQNKSNPTRSNILTFLN